jgi:DNA topoisomerase IB
VRIEDNGVMVFDFPAKSGQRRRQGIQDAQLAPIVGALKRRRGGGEELLAFKEGRRWRDVRSDDINAYLKEATGGDFSAKDFRTWNATALAAVALAVSGAAVTSKTARKRAIRRAIDEVAQYLGNTPAVCRASYIDPRVFDAFDAGLTIRPALERVAARVEPGELPIHQPALEAAVIDLIREDEDSAALEQVAA